MGIKIKVGSRQQCVPEGKYRSKIIEIHEGTFGNKRKILEFYFEIADGPHKGVTIRGFINAHYETFSEHSKLRKWMAILNKDDVQAGDEVDLDIFYGKILSVQVETKVSKKTGNLFSNVTNILGVEFDLEL